MNEGRKWVPRVPLGLSQSSAPALANIKTHKNTRKKRKRKSLPNIFCRQGYRLTWAFFLGAKIALGFTLSTFFITFSHTLVADAGWKKRFWIVKWWKYLHAVSTATTIESLACTVCRAANPIVSLFLRGGAFSWFFLEIRYLAELGGGRLFKHGRFLRSEAGCIQCFCKLFYSPFSMLA